MHVTGPELPISAVPELADNEVHVWRADLTDATQAEKNWRTLLSVDESERSLRFRFAKDRQNFIAVRALLRRLLASYLDRAPEKLVFVYSPAGKPALYESEIRFNLSHSGEVALLAFARNREVGIDLELVRRNVEVESIAHRFFSPHEQQELAAIDGDERFQAFFRGWTRKEAYLKATGAGLTLPLSNFDVSLSAGNPDCLLNPKQGQPQAIPSWRLCDLTTSGGYVAALCARGRDWVLRDQFGRAPRP
jgi:4'-phosphopantetheinyl transferase